MQKSFFLLQFVCLFGGYNFLEIASLKLLWLDVIFPVKNQGLGRWRGLAGGDSFSQFAMGF